jgi:hypothetical protein
MVVIIQGVRLDLNHLYKISKIYEDERYGRIVLGFSLKFINGNSVHIGITNAPYEIIDNEFSIIDILIEKPKVTKRLLMVDLVSIRTFIEKHWSKESKIPSIEITETRIIEL